MTAAVEEEKLVAVDEAANHERRYADELIGALRRDGRVLIERAELVGSYPDSTLVVVFRVKDRPCRFGVNDRIWDEAHPERYDVTRAVTSTYLRWTEALDTGELPDSCQPDSDGITWLPLWDDWS